MARRVSARVWRERISILENDAFDGWNHGLSF